MTAADVARFALIIALGFFAFLAFLFAGTIVGLMWLEASRCNCLSLPVGLYVLALLGIFMFVTMIQEGLEIQPIFEGWLEHQREALIIGLIFAFVILLILL